MKLRGAVVGVGYLGSFHAQKYRNLCGSSFSDRIQFVGVFDSLPAQAQKVAQENQVEAFASLESLVGKVDLVTIATVTSTHYELAKFLLAKDIHINVEKPMTVTLEQAKELNALAQAKGLVLCVGQSERWNSTFQALKTKIQSPQYAELNRHAPYKARGADVSVVHDLMIHDLDLVLALDQSPWQVTEVVGGRLISPTWDYAAATLQFQSGFCARISVSRLASAMTRSMKIVEEGQVLEGNLQSGELAVTKLDGQGQLQTQSLQCAKSDNLLLETEAFFSACLREKPPVVSGIDGQKALQVAEEICQRLEQKQ